MVSFPTCPGTEDGRVGKRTNVRAARLWDDMSQKIWLQRLAFLPVSILSSLLVQFTNARPILRGIWNERSFGTASRIHRVMKVQENSYGKESTGKSGNRVSSTLSPIPTTRESSLKKHPRCTITVTSFHWLKAVRYQPNWTGCTTDTHIIRYVGVQRVD